MNRRARILLLASVALLWILACSDDPKQMEPEVDVTPPERVLDLRTNTLDHDTIVLNWTAPGDDSLDGTAVSYDIRAATTEIRPETFDDALPVPQNLRPVQGGFIERLSVEGLQPLTRYCFALKATDDAGNTSEMSNLHCDVTAQSPDFTPPATVEDLAVVDSTSTTVMLEFTAPGDDGPVGTPFGYEIRYLGEQIDEANWAEASVIGETPIPSEGGTREIIVATGLEPDTLYYFALIAVDEALNRSEISNNTSARTLAG